jgi:YMGG-like Gly-zipper
MVLKRLLDESKNQLTHIKFTIMKKLFVIIGSAVLLFSCKSKSADETKVLSASKDAEYTEFVKWKEAKEKAAETAQPAATNTTVKTIVVKEAAPAPVYAAAPVATRKKGWSKAAKGTVIGAGTGAVAGAIINKKNRGVGAVIGGILGAGAGYGIGRSMDKKDGRY